MQPDQARTAAPARGARARAVVLVVYRTGVGLLLGGLLVPVELLYLLGSGLVLLPLLLWPRARTEVTERCRGLAVALTELHQARLSTWLGAQLHTGYPARSAVGYLLRRWVIGLLGGTILVLLGTGAALMGSWALTGFRPDPDADPVPLNFLLVVLVGLVLLYLAVQGLAGVAELDRTLAARLLGPSEQERLRRRISELSTSRSEVIAAVNDERRRIERDLHDGVQQRLVALGMLLGRARRGTDAQRGDALLRQAHEQAQQALHDLREVAWRVYPSTLDTLGLPEVLADLAQRCAVPVELDYPLAERAPRGIETVVYFVVSEALTNVVKHAAATRAQVLVRREGDRISVRVTDDGAGGADTGGRGLAGLAGRVAALDGEFTVHSPPGGPTSVHAVLPCG